MNRKMLCGLLLFIIFVLFIGCGAAEKVASKNNTEFTDTTNINPFETSKQDDPMLSDELSNSALIDKILNATYYSFPEKDTPAFASFYNSDQPVTIQKNSLLMGPTVVLSSDTCKQIEDGTLSFYDAIMTEESNSSQIYCFGTAINETGDKLAISYMGDPRGLDYFSLSEEEQSKNPLSVADTSLNSERLLIPKDVFTDELLDELRNTELDLDVIKVQYIYFIWPIYFKSSILIYDGNAEYLLMLEDGGLEYHHAELMNAQSIYEDFPKLSDNNQYLIYYHKGDLLNIKSSFISDLTKVMKHYRK